MMRGHLKNPSTYNIEQSKTKGYRTKATFGQKYFYFRSACAIEEEDQVVITGGLNEGGEAVKTVARYNIDGYIEGL